MSATECPIFVRTLSECNVNEYLRLSVLSMSRYPASIPT